MGVKEGAGEEVLTADGGAERDIENIGDAVDVGQKDAERVVGITERLMRVVKD